MRCDRLLVPILMLLPLLSRCGDDNPPEYADEYDRRQAAAHGRDDLAAPEPSGADQRMPTARPAVMRHPLRGIVRETMRAGRYVYLRLETDGGPVWAAATQMEVSVGDTVELTGAATMRNFRSETLGRTFDTILFVSSARVVGDGAAAAPPTGGSAETASANAASAGATGLPPGHPPMGAADDRPAAGSAAAPKPGEIEKLADGQSVAELFARKTELVGRTVRLRGRVVKASRGIMGLNWMHIQDGTGAPGGTDVTVTSASGFAPAGTIVVVEGTLDVDKAVGKDLGMNYFFPVIIEKATITPEPGKGEPGE